MSSITVRCSETLPYPENEVNIINRREIMPLLDRAWQVLRYYDKAVDCSAAVLDRSGKIFKTQDYEGKIRYCEFCERHFHNSFQIWQGNESPCEKIHMAALAESRRNEEVYIYTCPAGFIFWTSPLYRNGRYAGALTAGKVILLPGEESKLRGATAEDYGRGSVVEKFRALCKDKISVQKFSSMIKEVPEKSHEEILAMARLLGICAEEISESGEDSGDNISRMTGFKAWKRLTTKNSREIPRAPMKKNRPAIFARHHTNFHLELPHDAGYTPEGNRVSPMMGPDESQRGFLEKERMLLAAFRRGDNGTGGRILKELMDNFIAAIPGDLEIIRFRAIELVVLLSRAAVSGGESRIKDPVPFRAPAAGSEAANGNILLEVNDRYLRRIQESKTPEELIESLHLIAERMAGRLFSFQGIRHASVLRKAERYIWENYSRKLSLDEIAKASGLSAPYFSTIFKEEMGENLSNYLNRLRVEKATTLLTETGKSLNEIAGLCGFEDQSWFSKIFKSFTGLSPGKFRENGRGAA